MNRTAKVLRGIALAGIFAAAALAQPAQPAAAVLTVSGNVPSPVRLRAEDLAKMPRETVTVSEHDASVRYEGVPLRAILERAGAPLGKELRGKALSTYVLATARDGYQVVFTLAEVDANFANESILVADKRNGAAMSASQGPLRVVCPHDKEGARSVRMLETLDIVRLRK